MQQAQRIWTAALGEMQLQMTKATFDTWLAGTEALEFDDSRLVVAVASHYTKEWLENRLQVTIERTLTGILGYPVCVAFLVTPAGSGGAPLVTKELEAGEVAVKFYEWDPMRRGFLMMPKYCEWFWQPLLGCVTYATYRFLRSLDKQNEGWGRWHFVKVDEIAATLDVNRQKITGVERKKKDGSGKYWQAGAFDGLQQAAVARVEILGHGKKNISYRISCLHELPLLVPQQVERLREELQIKHARFLQETSIEYEEWQQLEIPSLVRE